MIGRGKDAPPTCPLGERGQEGRKDARPSPRDTQAPHPRPGPAQPSPDLLTAPPGGRSWVGAGASPRRKGPLGRGSQESHSSLVSLETLLQVLALLLLRVILCPLQTVLCVSAKRKTKGKDRAQAGWLEKAPPVFLAVLEASPLHLLNVLGQKPSLPTLT